MLTTEEHIDLFRDRAWLWRLERNKGPELDDDVVNMLTDGFADVVRKFEEENRKRGGSPSSFRETIAQEPPALLIKGLRQSPQIEGYCSGFGRFKEQKKDEIVMRLAGGMIRDAVNAAKAQGIKYCVVNRNGNQL